MIQHEKIVFSNFFFFFFRSSVKVHQGVNIRKSLTLDSSRHDENNPNQNM